MTEKRRTSNGEETPPVDRDLPALARLAFGRSTIGPGQVGADTASSAPGGTPRGTVDLDLDDPALAAFGDYTLLAKLGEGGMGVVYRAHQHSLDREVAVKLLAADPWASPDFIERFRLEAQSAARMQHPNIVGIHEIGEQDGLPYFSMALVRGESLAERLQRGGALAPRAAAVLMRVVAEAVDYAHRLGVLHLDLKPGNVLLDQAGEPRVADFGLARRLGRTLAAGPGVVSGTPSYMAPEQAEGDAELGPATDVYALGATLFEALTGQPPFAGTSARDTLDKVRNSPVPEPRSLDARIPLDLQAICLRCLAKRPADRYPGARALAEDLGRYLEGREVQARPLARWQRGLRLVRREPRLSALAGLLLASLLTGLIATTLQWNRADANAEQARQHLWGTRAQAAESALAEGDGFRGLRAMVENLLEMEAAGRTSEAAIERQRIGIVRASAPRPLGLLQMDPGAAVSSVAIAPDGRHFAVALHHSTGGREVRKYPMDGDAPVWTTAIEGLSHASPFADAPGGDLRFSSDGGHLLAAAVGMPVMPAPSQSDMIAVDATDGTVLMPERTGPGHADLVFSPDLRLALVRSRSDPSMRFPDRVQLHAVEGWRPLGPVRAQRAVQWLFSPDGSGLLGTEDSARFDFVDPRSFQPRWTATVPAATPARAWRFDHRGAHLALGLTNGAVVLIAVADGGMRWLPSASAATIRWLEFSADDRSLAGLAEDGTVLVWDLAGGGLRVAPIRERVGNRMGRVRLAGDLLLRPVDHELRAWSLPPPAPFDSFAVPLPVRLAGTRDFMSHAFDLHRESGLLVAGGSDGSISLWRVPVGGMLPARAAPLPTGSLRFDGRRLLAVDGARVQVVSADDGRPSGPVAVHPQAVGLAEFSADGNSIVTVAGRSLRVLDARDMRERAAPIVLPQTPLRAALASQAPVLALTTGGYVEGRYVEQVWTLDIDRVELRTQAPLVGGPLHLFALDPLGRFVLTRPNTRIEDEPLLRILDLGGWPAACTELRRPGEAGLVTAAVVAQDGRHAWLRWSLPERRTRLSRVDLRDCSVQQELELPSAGYESHLIAMAGGVAAQKLVADGISLVDAAGRRRDVPALGGSEAIHEFAVSTDGRRAAQATRNAVQIVDLETGRRLSALLPLPLAGNDAIVQLAFSPPGDRLLARSVRGRWLVWDLPTDDTPAEELAELVQLLAPTGAAPRPTPDATRALAARLRASAAAAGRGDDPDDWPQVALAAAPGEVVDARFLPLDLGPEINLPIGGNGPSNVFTPGDLVTLAPGLHRFNGIDFLIAGGVQLSGGGPAISIHPTHLETGEVPVPAVRARKVHALVMQLVPVSPRQPPRRFVELVLSGAGGGEHALEVLLGRHVTTLSLDSALVPDARLGWVGVFPASLREGHGAVTHTGAHVYLASLDVPPGVGPIRGLRLRAGQGSMEAPMVYAVTLEIDPGLPADAHVDGT
ncbi:MAG: protein kinase [Xanthomonadales bacterium]|nr:protein kinase [Xanthomonadales bacterium]